MLVHREKLRDTHGCLTCREARKKCNYERPSCSLCVKLGRICRWPDTDSQPSSRSLRKPRRPQLNIALCGSDQVSGTSMVKEIDTRGGTIEFMVQFYLGVVLKRTWTAISSMEAERGSIPPDRLAFSFIENESSVAYSCLTACACSAFAQSYNMADLKWESIRKYYHCIRKVNRLLEHPSAYRNTDILISVSWFTFFEYMNALSAQGWVQHVLGLGQLIEAQGPHSFKTLPKRLIVEHARWMIIAAALFVGKTTFFSLSAWKLIPWSSCPNGKGFAQSLLDIMADLPGCTEQLTQVQDALQDHGQQAQNFCKTVLKLQSAKIYKLFFNLHEWRQQFERAQGDTSWAWEVISNARDQDLIDSPFQPSTHFANASLSSSILFYDTTLIFLCAVAMHANSLVELLGVDGTIEFTEDDVPQPLTQTSHLSALAIPVGRITDTARNSAYQLATCMDYILSPEHLGVHSIFHLFPLTTAYHTFGGQRSQQGRLIADTLDSRSIDSLLGRSPLAHFIRQPMNGWARVLRPLIESWELENY